MRRMRDAGVRWQADLFARRATTAEPVEARVRGERLEADRLRDMLVEHRPRA